MIIILPKSTCFRPYFVQIHLKKSALAFRIEYTENMALDNCRELETNLNDLNVAFLSVLLIPSNIRLSVFYVIFFPFKIELYVYN